VNVGRLRLAVPRDRSVVDVRTKVGSQSLERLKVLKINTSRGGQTFRLADRIGFEHLTVEWVESRWVDYLFVQS